MKVIHVIRKPLAGTVAQNSIKHGTGGLNIDGSRIGTTESLNGGAYSGGVRPTSHTGNTGDAGGTSSLFEAGGGRLPPTEYQQPSGRWPANVILEHLDDCRKVGERVVPGQVLNRYTNARRNYEFYLEGDNDGPDLDNVETGDQVEDIWECVESCPVKMLDEQTGSLAKQGAPKIKDTGDSSMFGGGLPSTFYGDLGGASRFFKQVGGSEE